MKYLNFPFLQTKFSLVIFLYFSISIFCVNTTPIVENEKEIVEENGNKINGNIIDGLNNEEDLNSPSYSLSNSPSFPSSSSLSSPSTNNDQTEIENESLSPVRIENSNNDIIENNNDTAENENKSEEIEYEANNEEILKPLKYAQKQILIVLGSLLDDENSLKMIFEENEEISQDDSTDALTNEENNLTNSKEIESTPEENSHKVNEINHSSYNNEKLVKILKNVRENSFDSFCPQGSSINNNEVFDLLQSYVQQMMKSKKTVKNLIKKINLIINKNGGENKNRLKNNFALIIKRFNSRKLQKHLHYIQDINKNNKNKIIEDFEGKINFFLFLNFWSISTNLRDEAQNLKKSIPKGHLFFYSLKNEKEQNKLLKLQINLSDCLLNGLVKNLENSVLKSIFENDKVELVKQIVRMTISPFIKEPNLVNNAFGLQQTVENVCDINLIHKKPSTIFKQISKENKDLEKVKDLIFGSIFNYFYYIGGFLGANYHQILEMLEKSKEKEEESKELGNLKKIQINRLFGHFYNFLLSKYGEELKGTKFEKWLFKLKEMLLKKPKVVKEKIMVK